MTSHHDITSSQSQIYCSNKRSICSQYSPNISTVLRLLHSSTSFCWKMSFALDRCQHQEAKRCMIEEIGLFSLMSSTYICTYIYRDLQLGYLNGAIHIDLDILRSILNHPERLYSRLKYLTLFTFFSFFACDNTTYWLCTIQSHKFSWRIIRTQAGSIVSCIGVYNTSKIWWGNILQGTINSFKKKCSTCIYMSK